MSGSWLNISTPLTPYIYHSIIVIMIIKNNFNSLVPRLTFFSSSPFLFSRAFRNSVMNCSLCCFLQSDTHVHNYMYTCVYVQTDRQTDTDTHLDCICISLSRILNFFSKDVGGPWGFKASPAGPSKARHSPSLSR